MMQYETTYAARSGVATEILREVLAEVERGRGTLPPHTLSTLRLFVLDPHGYTTRLLAGVAAQGMARQGV